MMMFKEVDAEIVLFVVAFIACIYESCTQDNHKSFSFST